MKFRERLRPTVRSQIGGICPKAGRSSILSIKRDLVTRIGGRFAGEKAGEFIAPHGCAVDSSGDLYVAEVSRTSKGSQESPPREIGSLQKFERA